MRCCRAVAVGMGLPGRVVVSGAAMGMSHPKMLYYNITGVHRGSRRVRRRVYFCSWVDWVLADVPSVRAAGGTPYALHQVYVQFGGLDKFP